MYEVTTEAKGNPHLIYGSLRQLLNAKIKADNNNPLHYITQTTNTEDGLKITATYSDERKIHFDENPL